MRRIAPGKHSSRIFAMPVTRNFYAKSGKRARKLFRETVSLHDYPISAPGGFHGTDVVASQLKLVITNAARPGVPGCGHRGMRADAPLAAFADVDA